MKLLQKIQKMGVFDSMIIRHIIFHAVFLWTITGGSSSLEHMLHHYEPLYYDHLDLQSQHQRARRSTDETLQFKFTAFNRSFHIHLKNDPNVFESDILIENSIGPLDFDIKKIYTGYLQGEGSRVDGIVTSSGHFQGQIHTSNETYYIEPAHWYFRHVVDFQGIAYRHVDINYSSTFCKADELRHKIFTQLKGVDNKGHNIVDHSGEKPEERYSYASNQNSRRHKRSIDPLKTVCTLYLQADHLFYQRFGSNHEAVIEQLGSYVQSVNTIFKPIEAFPQGVMDGDFDSDSSADNIHFIVKRIKILDDPNAAGYKFPGSYSVDKFLDIHSSENYNDFCLSYMFTDRDFDDGVLGLAWVASASYSGGVCDTYKTYIGGESKSLNTGIVTVKNYGKTVASAVTQVTFAHEIGHNFGSSHDVGGSSCAPGGDQGNYIMYASATPGTLPNNRLFSSCSISVMGPILEQKARGSTGCFIEPPASVCGNRIVEGSEECDCGWDDECDDICCHPATTTGDASIACTYNNTQSIANFCSPSNGLCCSDSCTIWQLSDNYVCRQNTSCLDKAECDGSGYECPASNAMANGTSCAEGQVCYLGECTGSVCLANNLQSCQCSGYGFKDPKLCDLCCVDGNGTCRLANEITSSITETKAVSGSPCYNYQGYCDVFFECKKVDPNGPLSNLNQLLFSGELLETVKTFLTEKWYIALAGGLGIVILMGIFIKVCSKSHDPKKKKQVKKRNPNRVSPNVLHM